MGSGSVGVNFINSLELMKFTGALNVTDWGGSPDFGGGSRWISGYDIYYNAMLNKVDEYYSISFHTEEGLNILKNWLHNHCENSPTGGVAGIYVNLAFTNMHNLPAGTPESGKIVITEFGFPSTHALTIVGYNDSIRWDYNLDGLYTNNKDINGDGMIDMKDWEIGGFKIVNTNSIYFGNDGFSYVMYKTHADTYGDGGIWNNMAFVIKPKPNYSPLMTYKITIEHPSRRDLSIEAGISQHPGDTVPEYTMEPTIVNYQGGDQYMQGGDSIPSNQTLEFGLDVTPLLSYVQSGQPARFFFRVKEFDLNTQSNGQITAFSLMDYHSGITETANSTTPVPITNNGITTLMTDYTPVFDQPVITEDTLPEMTLYDTFSYQMNATGGQPPYKWKIRMNYNEQETQDTFPNISSTLLNLGDWTSGTVELPLHFSFPFYNKEYNSIYVHTDGFISFDGHDLPWVYYFDENKVTFLKFLNGIAVFLADLEMLYSWHGTWAEQYNDSVVIRWSAVVPDYIGGHYEVNAAVMLRSDGSISFYYGDCETMGFQWTAGISNGDICNWQETRISNSTFTISGNKSATIYPDNINNVNDLSLSESGVFNGIPGNIYNDYPLQVEVTDYQGIRNSKNVYLNSRGLHFDYSINSGGDTLIEYGEQAVIDIMVTNSENSTVDNIIFTFSSANPLTTVSDSILTIASLNAGQQLTIPAAFSFTVSDQLQNNEDIPISFQIESSLLQQERNDTKKGYRPDLSIVATYNSGTPYPVWLSGDTALLEIVIRNLSPARLRNGICSISNTAPYLTVLSGPVLIDTLCGYSFDTLVYQVTVQEETPNETTINALLCINAEHQFQQCIPTDLSVNFNQETFESGDLLSYTWNTFGPKHWYVTHGGHNGIYCARSGSITHSQISALIVAMETTHDGMISFFISASSEPMSDYLQFFIDNEKKNEWSGMVGWRKVTYPVSAGPHTFKWVYLKNATISEGNDCGWLDDIVFPPFISSELPFVINDRFSLTVFPNPAEDRIYILTDEMEKVMQLNIYTSTGQIVSTCNTVSDPISIDISNLREGLYFIESKRLNGNTYVKFIKTKK
jgi:hypothetical protein